MNDRAILFFCILMILVFFYRIILSVLILLKKVYIIDEKYYISVFYCSLVSILVLLTDWIIVGSILFIILPIILMFYVSLAKTRKYWIINGWEITESKFLNPLIADHPELKDTQYRINHLRFSRKPKEYKTKLEFLNLKYEEKEILFKEIKQICKENVKKTNKHEIITILLYFAFILVLSIFIIITLFT